MRIFAATLLASLVAGSLPASCGVACAASPAWEGRGAYRLLVEVAPVDIARRRSDELVASCDVDLAALRPNVPQEARLDPTSIQIMRYDAESGRPEPYADYSYATSPCDRPFQFDDATYPIEFPDYERYLSHQATRPFVNPKLIPHGARNFNVVGAARRGRLVWPHTQQGDAAAHYAIYFDLLPPEKQPPSPPAGFVGDGSSRALRESLRFGPAGNINGRAVDWNDDGLTDILFGSADGHFTLYLNDGRPAEPRFRTKLLLCDDAGKPIDVGYSSCPQFVDWNGDGKRDIVSGAEKGCVVWYENVGERDAAESEIAKFKFAGFIESDGGMIVTPAKPIAEGRGEEAFKEDYFPVQLVVDWDGDDDLDLLLGGYVTGLTFVYENVAAAGTLPILKPRGPLADAGGATIDVGWMAAPAAHDLDGDGDLDLLLGAKPVNEGGGDTSDATRALLYYRNVGTRSTPRLERATLPVDAPLPFGGMVTPSFADWNADGLDDLIVVDVRQKVYAFPNKGTRAKPLFDVTSGALRGTWQTEGFYADALADIDGDGYPDVLNAFSVLLNDGSPSPGRFDKRINFAAGKVIRHPVPHGDENRGVILHDLDGDGALDALYGSHSGHIWFHKNAGTNLKPNLDAAGVQLRQTDGAAIKVGLPEGAKPEKFDFNVLQGARPKPVAADFNSDGLTDLIVGDTYGKVRYYENKGTKAEPRFAPPVLIADRRSRLYLSTLDWNADGVPDLVVLKGGLHVFVNKAMPNKCEFESPRPIDLPATQGYLLSVCPVDWNRDGDEDLLTTSAAGNLCFLERSFLRHGYRPARLLDMEAKSIAAQK